MKSGIHGRVDDAVQRLRDLISTTSIEKKENTSVSASEFTDPVMFLAEGYEYKVQRRVNGHWYNTSTNHFDSDVWYPTLSSGKNALAQHKVSKWGHTNTDEYRLVRRPYGQVEAIG